MSTYSFYRKLVEKFPFIDAQRVGLWGWSYGGYATTHVLARDNGTEHVYKCGISVGAGIDWLLYGMSRLRFFISQRNWLAFERTLSTIYEEKLTLSTQKLS